MLKPGSRSLTIVGQVWLTGVFLALAGCAGLPANLSLPGQQPAAVTQTTAVPGQGSPMPGGSEPGAFTPTFTAINGGAPGTGTPAFNCIPQKGEISAGIVSQVLSGDTIEIRDAQKNEYFKVKYIGIRAPGDDPKKPEFYGNQATIKNRQLVAGKTVILITDVTDKDSRGYLLRYVFAGDTFVNYEMVRQGFAFAWPTPPNVACWEAILQAENEIKGKQMGVWAITPTPPKGGKATTPYTAGQTTPTIQRTPTEKGPCDCRGPKLDCTNFTGQPAAQACFTYCKGKGWGDIFGLDSDNDGQACTGQP